MVSNSFVRSILQPNVKRFLCDDGTSCWKVISLKCCFYISHFLPSFFLLCFEKKILQTAVCLFVSQQTRLGNRCTDGQGRQTNCCPQRPKYHGAPDILAEWSPQSTLNIGILRHALGSEFAPHWWQLTIRPKHNIYVFHDFIWFIEYDIC